MNGQTAHRLQDIVLPDIFLLSSVGILQKFAPGFYDLRLFSAKVGATLEFVKGFSPYHAIGNSDTRHR